MVKLYPHQRWVDKDKKKERSDRPTGQKEPSSWNKSSIDDVKKKSKSSWKTVHKADWRDSVEDELQASKFYHPTKQYRIVDKGSKVESDRYELQEKIS